MKEKQELMQCNMCAWYGQAKELLADVEDIHHCPNCESEDYSPKQEEKEYKVIAWKEEGGHYYIKAVSEGQARSIAQDKLYDDVPFDRVKSGDRAVEDVTELKTN